MGEAYEAGLRQPIERQTHGLFPDYFTITVGFDGNVVLFLRGELDMGSEALFGEALTAIIEAGERSVVVDLANLKFMDSSGLHALMRERSRLEAGGGYLFVRNQRGQVRRLFQVTGLSEEFPDGAPALLPIAVIERAPALG